MSKAKKLSSVEKCKIITLLSKNFTTSEVAKEMSRDIRTIKKFANNPAFNHVRRDKGKLKVVSRRQMTQLKRAMAKNPLSTSQNVFIEAGIACQSRSSRCRVLRKIGCIAKAKKIPPLSKENITKRLNWARNNMKTNFSDVIFTDECRATLDGPDGFARGWCPNGKQTPLRQKRQQGGGGVMFWAGLHGNMLIGMKLYGINAYYILHRFYIIFSFYHVYI